MNIERKNEVIGKTYKGQIITSVRVDEETGTTDLWLFDGKRVSFSKLENAIGFVLAEEIENMCK